MLMIRICLSNKYIGDDTKAATRWSPKSVRKTKKTTFCATRVCVQLPNFCEKLLPHAKFHWNRTIGCWVMAKKRVLDWRPSAIFNFKNVRNIIWSHGCHRVLNVLLCNRFFVRISAADGQTNKRTKQTDGEALCERRLNQWAKTNFEVTLIVAYNIGYVRSFQTIVYGYDAWIWKHWNCLNVIEFVGLKLQDNSLPMSSCVECLLLPALTVRYAMIANVGPSVVRPSSVPSSYLEN